MRHSRMTMVVLAMIVAGSLGLHAQKPAPATPLDTILKEVATYDGGIESAAMWKLRDYVEARKDDPAGRAECEAKLLAFLKTPATQTAKMAACKYLRLIGSDQAVPALQPMLLDDRAADMALYALQQIPGAAVDKALLQTLSMPKVGSPTRIAIIAALGNRGSTDAVPALVPFLKQPEFARPAALALGAIGSGAAAQALVDIYKAGSPADAKLKPTLAAATLKCAEKSLAARDNAAALRLYDTLWADSSLPVPLRRAVAIGRISASGNDAPATLMALLKQPDTALQEAAITEVRDVIPPERISQVCALLPQFAAPLQVKLLAVLSVYPTGPVLPTIVKAAGSTSVDVRLAALKALESVGDESVVPFLADTAARSRGPEQAAARSAFGLLKGPPVDDAIVKALGNKPAEDVRTELLLAAAERRIFAARPVVISALASSSPVVRVQALKTLRAVGTPSDMFVVLDLLVKAGDDAERTEAGQTVAALAQKMANADDRSSAVKARIAAEKDPRALARLVAVLPLVGDASALPVLRTALGDPNADVYDAAVRALVSWPTLAAREDVLALSRDARNETHRLLAIHGLLGMIGRDRYRDPKAAVADLKQAAGYAWRPEEQKLVLGVLAQFPCDDALQLATSYLREPAVKAEAEAAVEKIKAKLGVKKTGTHDH